MATQPGKCPHCGKEFDHLPSHKWQCPEKPDENNKREPEPEDDPGDEESAQQNSDDSQETSGVKVDEVVPDEKDTRKNPEEPDTSQDDDGDEWVEIDYNSGKQVKCIIRTTEVDDVRKAQKLLKAFKTGNVENIPQFDEIRLSDGELR